MLLDRSALLRFFPEPVRARFHFPISAALRRALASGYDKAAFKADVLAGLVVGVVALPLCMALAIAVGVPPHHGLYTAIVAGSVVALTGGSKYQVTGPTAAFVVILAPIASRHGLSGLLTAGLMAGVLLLAMGAARLGKLIQFIPHPVTTGFTAGIATVIATMQLKDVLGLSIAMPETYLEKLVAIWHARHATSLPDVCVALGTVAILIGLPKWRPSWTARVPAPLIAMVVASLGVVVARKLAPALEVATLGTRFHFEIDGRTIAGIPAIPPRPILPWGSDGLSLGDFSNLGSAAFAIAMLGAIESLLSAVIADGMTGKKHDPDAELIGLGLGNIVAPFFGGIAATGALARTATNVRAGARSPISAVVHAVIVLLAVVLLAPLLAHVPMAALAGLLLVVAWNMSERRHFITTIRIAPKSDVTVLLTCYVLTVLFDMVIAVSVGIVLASLLFMKRSAELTHSRLLEKSSADLEFELPPGVAVYEVAGPLFFGAAQNAMGALHNVNSDSRVVMFALGRVPSIDATGLVALESALSRLKQAKKLVVIAGPLPEPRRVFAKAGLADHHDHLHFADTFTAGLALAGSLAARAPER